jgi:hypothetical protein
VKDLYGFERWETGELARSSRGYRKYSQDSINNEMIYHVGGRQLNAQQWQQQLAGEAHDLAKRLTEQLADIKGLGADQPLSFDQLMANFKDNKPLGLMADGQPHPFSEQIEIIFNQQMSDLADYADSQWLRDKSPIQVTNKDQSAPEFIADIVEMITLSKKVWTFDEMLNIDDSLSESDSKQTS